MGWAFCTPALWLELITEAYVEPADGIAAGSEVVGLG